MFADRYRILHQPRFMATDVADSQTRSPRFITPISFSSAAASNRSANKKIPAGAAACQQFAFDEFRRTRLGVAKWCMSSHRHNSIALVVITCRLCGTLAIHLRPADYVLNLHASTSANARLILPRSAYCVAFPTLCPRCSGPDREGSRK
jgi:hypothetical protein